MAAFIKGHTKVGGRKKGDRNKPGPRQHAKLIFGDDFRAALLEELAPHRHAVMMLRVSKGDYDGALVAAEKAGAILPCQVDRVRSEGPAFARRSIRRRLGRRHRIIRQKLALARPAIDLKSEHVLTGNGTGDSSTQNTNNGEIPRF